MNSFKKISLFMLMLNSLLMGVYGIGLIVKPGLIISGLEQYSSTVFTNQNRFF
jgi:hypothetical protein